MRNILTLAALYLLTIITFAQASNHGSSTIPYIIDTTNNNISVGPGSMGAVTTGTQNICIGNSTCAAITTGGSNVIIQNGENKLTDGNTNILIGYLEVPATVHTANAVGIGNSSIVGTDDTAVGQSALAATVTDFLANSAFGFGALGTTTTGAQNTAVGYLAFSVNRSGSKNVAVGSGAGTGFHDGNQNVVIGYNVATGGNTRNGSNNILIGTSSAIDVTTSTVSNEIHMGGTGGDWITVTGTNTNSTEAATMNGTLNVTGTISQNGSPIGGSYNPAAVAITGGTINNTTMGATTSSSALFTTVTAGSLVVGGNANLNSFQLNGLENPEKPGGRISLSASNAVMTADVPGSVTVYYLPYNTQNVPIYNGSHWINYDIGSGGLSLTLNQTNHVAGKVFDLYAINNSGAPVLCAMNWGGTTSRSSSAGGTGANQDARIARQNGLWTNSAAIAASECYNNNTAYTASANQATLLGSFYTLKENGASTLGGTTTAGTTALTLTTTALKGPGIVGVNYYAALDATTSIEYVLVTGGWNTTSITVTRGQLGTSAISHNSGKAVAVAPGQTAVQCQNTAGASGGTAPLLGISNTYNTVPTTCTDFESNAGFTYATATWQPLDNNVLNEVTWVDSVQQAQPVVSFSTEVANSNAGNGCQAGLVYDSTTSANFLVYSFMNGTSILPMSFTGTTYPLLGLHEITPMQYAIATTCTFATGGGVFGTNTTLQISY